MADGGVPQPLLAYRHRVRDVRLYDQAMACGASQGGTFHARPRVRTFCGLVLPGGYVASAALNECGACAYAFAEAQQLP